MAHPKTRISKQRKHKRRTHYKIEAPNVVACSNCGGPKLTHHICGECGYYRSKPLIAVEAVEVVEANEE
jgi:large subunit ribosomal protein L32